MEYSNGIFNEAEFEPLLEVRGNVFKRMFYRNVVKISKSFYSDYVKWCKKNNKYVDFIQPLSWHLFCCGVGNWKIRLYLNNIKGRMLEYIRKESSDGQVC